MAYDDDDLFEDEFDFVDDDELAEDDSEKDSLEEPAPSEPKANKKRPVSKSKRTAKKAKKKAVAKRPSEKAEADVQENASDDDDEATAAPVVEEPAEPEGPPADHVIHIYEFGQFSRTLPRKFTDIDAVAFAEEYSRSGKSYGRLAIPASQDETPAQSFADAAKQ